MKVTYRDKTNIRGKNTENEVAIGSSFCSKDSLSLSAKCFFLLSTNSDFVFFLVLASVFFFLLSEDFSLFCKSFRDLNEANKEKRRAIKLRAITKQNTCNQKKMLMGSL